MAEKKAESVPSGSKSRDKAMSRKGDSMAKKKTKAESPFLGRWHIISMSTWDESYFNEEAQAYIEFKQERQGEFQFGYVRGELDYREGQRDGEPAVEWSWDGSDGADATPLTGRGWAVLRDEGLHGLIAIHMGDDSEFKAKRAVGTRRPKRKD